MEYNRKCISIKTNPICPLETPNPSSKFEFEANEIGGQLEGGCLIEEDRSFPKYAKGIEKVCQDFMNDYKNKDKSRRFGRTAEDLPYISCVGVYQMLYQYGIVDINGIIPGKECPYERFLKTSAFIDTNYGNFPPAKKNYSSSNSSDISSYIRLNFGSLLILLSILF